MFAALHRHFWNALALLSVVLLPLVFDDACQDAAMAPRQVVMGVATLIAVLVCIVAGRKQIENQPTIFLIATTAFLLLVFFNAAVAPDLQRAMLSAGRFATWFGWAVALAIAMQAQAHLHKWLFASATLAVWVQALIVLAQAAGLATWSIASVDGVTGTFANPNFLGSAMLMLLPLCVAGGLQLAGWLRWASWLAVVVATLLLLLSGARAALLGLIAAAAVAVPFLVDGPWRRWKVLGNPKMLVAVVLLSLGVLAVVFYNYLVDDSAPATGSMAALNSLKERAGQWHHSLQMIAEQPVAGVGLGQWAIEMPGYGIDRFVQEVRDGKMIYQRPHNDFLWLASELGVIGLLLFLVCLGIALRIGFNAWDNAVQSKRQQLVIAVAGLVAWLSLAMFAFPGERMVPMVLFGVYLAILIKDPATATSKSSRSWVLTGALGVLTVACAAGTWFAGIQWRHEPAVKVALAHRTQGNYAAVPGTLKLAMENGLVHDQTTTPLTYYCAEAALMQGEFNRAKTLLQEALQANPNHLLSKSNLAVATFQIGELEQALKLFEEVENLSPRFEEALLNKAVVQYQLGYYNAADSTLNCVQRSIRDPKYQALKDLIQAARRAEKE